MELGPIFRSLLKNRSRFWLIVLEVALTLAIVVNCVSLILDLRSRYRVPTGYDEESLIVAEVEPFGPEYAEEEYRNAVREDDLRRLRALPGVRAATAIQQIPLSGGGSATGRRPLGGDGEGVTTPYYVVADQPLETFGVRLVEGRTFEPGDFELEENESGGYDRRPTILSRPLAEKLFPDGDALGEVIVSSSGEYSDVVVGIVDTMHNSWVDWEGAGDTMLIPGKPGSQRKIRYMVRAADGAFDDVFAGLESALVEWQADRIVSVETLSEIKGDSWGDSLALMKILGAVAVLLIFVTSLGIVGLTAFSVTQRTREIGVRRALGATRPDILRRFLLENWMVTGFGLALGIASTFALNYALAQVADAPKVDWGLLGGGAVLLWVSGLLAALVPALRATRVAPEVATRTV